MSTLKKKKSNRRRGNQPPNPDDQKLLPSPPTKSYAWLWLIVLLILVVAGTFYYQVESTLYLITATSSAFTVFMIYIHQEPQQRSMKSLLIPACAVAIPMLSSNIYEKYNEPKSEPEFTIETKVSDDTVNIYLKVIKGYLTTWTIDYPVNGIITRIIDVNSAVDIRTISMTAVGAAEGISLNNAEIVISDIRSDINAQFTIIYKGIKGIPAGGRDTYRVTYTWKYKGNERSDTKWYLVKNDKKTDKAALVTRDVQVYDRAFTSEDVRRDYEEMSKRTIFRKKTFK